MNNAICSIRLENRRKRKLLGNIIREYSSIVKSQFVRTITIYLVMSEFKTPRDRGSWFCSASLWSIDMLENVLYKDWLSMEITSGRIKERNALKEEIKSRQFETFIHFFNVVCFDFVVFFFFLVLCVKAKDNIDILNVRNEFFKYTEKLRENTNSISINVFRSI